MIPRKVQWLVGIGLGCALGLTLVSLVLRYRRGPTASSSPTAASSDAGSNVAYEIAEVVYDGGFANGWKDWGWGPHEIADAGPARVKFADFGGIVFQHDELASRYGALVFRFRAPASYGDFLNVSLKNKKVEQKPMPRVKVEARNARDLGDGFREVVIPFSSLNPAAQAFDRIVIEAKLQVSSEWVLVDKVVLTKGSGDVDSAPARVAKLSIDCSKQAVRISPLIYGIAKGTPGLGETVHRVGGNTSTRLNWDLRGVWNTGSDWFFENVKGTDTGLADWIEEGHAAGVKMAVTVPMIGWVAKDATSVGFPISKLGPQRARDEGRPEAGDGFRPDGTPVTPGPPTTTSVAAPPEVIRRWIGAIRQKDAERGARGVDM